MSKLFDWVYEVPQRESSLKKCPYKCPVRKNTSVTERSQCPYFSQKISVDMVENENNFVVRVDLPGVERENIKVHVDQGMLSVSAERSNVRQEGDDDNYHFSERSWSSVSRTLPLPENASEEGVSAKFENGVLTLVLQKREVSSTRRVVNVE